MSIVIRVKREDAERLKALRKALGLKSISDVISLVIEAAEEELDKFKGNINALIKSLKYLGEAGERDSEMVDQLLYGERLGDNN